MEYDFFNNSQNLDYENIYEKLEFENIFGYLIKIVTTGFKNSSDLLALQLSVILIISVLNTFDFSGRSELKIVSSAVIGVAVISISIETVTSNVDMIKDTLENAKIFTTAAIPVVSALCLSSGQAFAAGVFSIGISVSATVFQFISDGILMSFALIYLMLGFCSIFTSDFNLSSVMKLIKKIFRWIVSIFLSLFTFSVSMQSFLTKAADNLTRKSIETAVGKFIPMIGNALSGSIESVFSLAAASKTYLSILGILIVITIFLPIIAGNICYGFTMLLSKHIASFFRIDLLSSVASTLSDVFFMLSAIISSCAFMVVVSFLLICINF